MLIILSGEYRPFYVFVCVYKDAMSLVFVLRNFNTGNVRGIRVGK